MHKLQQQPLCTLGDSGPNDWLSFGALPGSERVPVNRPFSGANVKEQVTAAAPGLGAVWPAIFQTIVASAETFYIDGNVTSERGDFVGSSKGKLM